MKVGKVTVALVAFLCCAQVRSAHRENEPLLQNFAEHPDSCRAALQEEHFSHIHGLAAMGDLKEFYPGKNIFPLVAVYTKVLRKFSDNPEEIVIFNRAPARDGKELSEAAPLIKVNFSPVRFTQDSVFTCDGLCVAQQEKAGCVAVLNVLTGKQVGRITEPIESLKRMFFNKAGTILVTCSNKETTLWDIKTGDCRAVFLGDYMFEEFSPDETKFLRVGLGSIAIEDVETGMQSYKKDNLIVFPRNEGKCIGVEWSSDSKVFAAWKSGDVHLFDSSLGVFLKVLKGRKLSISRRVEAKILPQKIDNYAPFIVTQGDFDGNDNTVKIWETQTGKLIRNFFTKQGPCTHARVSPDKKHLLMVGLCGATVWNISTGKEVQKLLDGELLNQWRGGYGGSSDTIFLAKQDSSIHIFRKNVQDV